MFRLMTLFSLYCFVSLSLSSLSLSLLLSIYGSNCMVVSLISLYCFVSLSLNFSHSLDGSNLKHCAIGLTSLFLCLFVSLSKSLSFICLFLSVSLSRLVNPKDLASCFLYMILFLFYVYICLSVCLSVYLSLFLSIGQSLMSRVV